MPPAYARGMMQRSARLLLAVLTLALVAPAAAQPANPITTIVRERIFLEQPWRGEEGGWVVTLSPGSEFTLPTSYGDADLTLTRSGVDLASEYWFSQQLIATFGIGAEYSHYSLSGFQRAVGLNEPIQNALRISLRPGVRFNFSREWGGFAFGQFEFAGDPTANLDKSFTGGGAGGVRWAPSEDFTLLLGAGAISRLDDTTGYYPILGINWKIDENWSLDTLGTGATLRYRLNDDWRLGIGGRYETRDYRLDDDVSVPDGVLRDDRALVELTATWRPKPAVDLTAGVGAVAWSELTVDTSGSDEVFSETGDPTVFFSLRGVVRF